MADFKVRKIGNGHIVWIDGTIKHNGEFVFKTTEEIKLLELLGEVLLDKRVQITEK